MPNPSNKSEEPKPSRFSKAKTTKKASFRKRSSEAPCWDDVSPNMVHAIVCACSTCNAPPTFGYTRDGTALTIAVYYDGERYLDYLSGPDEVAQYLDWLIDELLPLSDKERLEMRQARLG